MIARARAGALVILAALTLPSISAGAQEFAHADDNRDRIAVSAKSTDNRGHRRTIADRAVYLPHPPGCPARLFCGCGAAWDVFGQPVRSLWPSAAWFKFPRTSPAPNMVAVRRGHVFVLKQHVGGKVWLVNDYNSGGRKSRYHARSIAGYVIVDPRASYAMVRQ